VYQFFLPAGTGKTSAQQQKETAENNPNYQINSLEPFGIQELPIYTSTTTISTSSFSSWGVLCTLMKFLCSNVATFC